MVKQTVVHQYHGILLNNKMEQTIDTHKTPDESPGNYAEYKKPIPKDCILYNPMYITYFKWQIIEMEKLVVVRA